MAGREVKVRILSSLCLNRFLPNPKCLVSSDLFNFLRHDGNKIGSKSDDIIFKRLLRITGPCRSARDSSYTLQFVAALRSTLPSFQPHWEEYNDLEGNPGPAATRHLCRLLDKICSPASTSRAIRCRVEAPDSRIQLSLWLRFAANRFEGQPASPF